tara:strand:+ start:686 stop:832 length:147 start_codon:yes stop_codon:yes gene_type:complete
MSDKQSKNNEDSNIGKNTQWDTPNVDPNAGSTIRKPSTSLDPNKKGSK